jgi:DNA-binding Lrp family transcriptional regulator
MSNASVHNWVKLLESGDLDNYTIKVLKHIKDNPHTDIESMRNNLKISHQTLTSRISDLMDEGLVEIVGDKLVKQGINYSLFKFVEGTFRQNEVKKNRLKSKYISWVNRGMREYKDIMPSSLIMELSYIQSSVK